MTGERNEGSLFPGEGPLGEAKLGSCMGEAQRPWETEVGATSQGPPHTPGSHLPVARVLLHDDNTQARPPARPPLDSLRLHAQPGMTHRPEGRPERGPVLLTHPADEHSQDASQGGGTPDPALPQLGLPNSTAGAPNSRFCPSERAWQVEPGFGDSSRGPASSVAQGKLCALVSHL